MGERGGLPVGAPLGFTELPASDFGIKNSVACLLGARDIRLKPVQLKSLLFPGGFSLFAKHMEA